jgi:hypothetical protein
LTVASAFSDIAAGDLPAVARISAVSRGHEWVRCPGGYVDLDATRALWQRVAGTEVAEIFAEPADDGNHRLVGYAEAVDDRSVGAMHRRFVSSLDERFEVKAPDWYVRCAGSPRARTDRISWESLQVAEEGSGR